MNFILSSKTDSVVKECFVQNRSKLKLRNCDICFIYEIYFGIKITIAYLVQERITGRIIMQQAVISVDIVLIVEITFLKSCKRLNIVIFTIWESVKDIYIELCRRGYY